MLLIPDPVWWFCICDAYQYSDNNFSHITQSSCWGWIVNYNNIMFISVLCSWLETVEWSIEWKVSWQCRVRVAVQDNRRWEALVCMWKNNMVDVSHQQQPPRWDMKHGLIMQLVGEGFERANIALWFIHTQTDIRNGFANYPAACSLANYTEIDIYFLQLYF